MATYVSLVNEVLRRMNEVELDTGGNGFSDVRNLQALAKDAVNASVREILQTSQEWPFTLITYTQTLTAGTGTYDFPSDFSKADWDTFYIKKLTAKDNTPERLPLQLHSETSEGYLPQTQLQRKTLHQPVKASEHRAPHPPPRRLQTD